MGGRLIDADKLIELIDDDIASLNKDMSREGYDVCLCTLEMVKQYIKALPTIEAIPVEWIEKQKARCYPRSISWLALDALLKTWREEKDEVEE